MYRQLGRRNPLDRLAGARSVDAFTDLDVPAGGRPGIQLDEAERLPAINAMLAQLEQENVALDIGNYRSAPPGFRIWGGATVETSDLAALTPWLDWVFADYKHNMQENHHD